MALLQILYSLPRRLRRRLILRILPNSVALGYRFKFWARLHYLFLDRAFSREQNSLLAGRVAYSRSLKSPQGSMAILRRNVHRLEKGILMKPRRIPFAGTYIGETVDAFMTATTTSCGSIDPIEMEWASDVLSEYFEIHAGEDSLLPLKSRFESGRICKDSISARIPYRRDLSKTPPVSFHAINALVRQRRSVRWFLNRPVERSLLDKALEVGTQAPSACNRQPFQFRFFDEHDLVQKIIGIPFGLTGYGHQVPVVAVVVGQQRHFFDERDRHLIYIDASLAVMGFLLALETLGLASCCVNWPDIETNEQRMAKLLNLGDDERPVMLIALGYPDPDGMVANSSKKSLDQLRTYNFE